MANWLSSPLSAAARAASLSQAACPPQPRPGEVVGKGMKTRWDTGGTYMGSGSTRTGVSGAGTRRVHYAFLLRLVRTSPPDPLVRPRLCLLGL